MEAVREVRYGLFETEFLKMTRDQIIDLHGRIDSKETLLAALKKSSKGEMKVSCRSEKTLGKQKLPEAKKAMRR